jgi:hypothetical protein
VAGNSIYLAFSRPGFVGECVTFSLEMAAHGTLERPATQNPNKNGASVHFSLYNAP